MYTTKEKNVKKQSSLTIVTIFVVILTMIFNVNYVYANIGVASCVEDQFQKATLSFISTENNSIVKSLNTAINVTESTVKTIEMQKEERRQKQLLEQKMLAEQRKEELRLAKTVESSRNVQYYDINVYTDLSVMSTVTVDEMNEIIDYWSSLRGGNTTFKGQGQIFIDAAKKSGLDPIYILAHAAVESAWGTSNLALTYHNYFGIGAYDSNPEYASNYNNNDLAIGIIEGASWIADNFYDNGQTSLYTMRYNGGNHEYCSSEKWMHDIEHIMYTSYSLIQ